jgi:MazG family protein
VSRHPDAQAAFGRLVDIMETLRGPDGCPWDREQDLRSLRRYVLEEAYEVVQAIDDRDMEALPSELGDLLLQVVFLSQTAAEEGLFDVCDVAEAISDKLVRRHPHVFADGDAATAQEVLQRWESIKREERGGGSVLDDIPASFPALARAEKLGRRAAHLGFDWPDANGVLEKVREELVEVEDAVAHDGERPHGRASAAVEQEIGDLLFAVANLARRLGLSPEAALRQANEKFERRFRAIEPAIAAGHAGDPAAMDELWEAIKRGETPTAD